MAVALQRSVGGTRAMDQQFPQDGTGLAGWDLGDEKSMRFMNCCARTALSILICSLVPVASAQQAETLQQQLDQLKQQYEQNSQQLQQRISALEQQIEQQKRGSRQRKGRKREGKVEGSLSGGACY
jgi:gas vesicle protein